MLAVAMSTPRINGAQHAAPLQENFAVSEKSSGRLCRANQRFDHGTENDQPIRGLQRGLNGALRMRHQAGHVALAVANSCNVVERTIGIARGVICAVRSCITEKDLAIFFEVSKRGFVGVVVAVIVGYGDFQHLALQSSVGEGCIGLLDADEHVAANVAETRIAHHGAGKQASFEKNLKTVADAENHAAGLGEFFHGLHYRREPRNRSGTQIVPISEAARQDNGVAIGKVLRLVPDELYGLFEDVADGVKRVVIAVGARKDNYSKFHAVIAP